MGLFGCANDAADAGVTAATCVENDLVEQCPPNTTARLEADSAAVCNESSSINIGVTSGDGQVDNVCVGTGSCQLACELVNPCLYGVVSVSPTEGVICFIPEGMGNGVCDPGDSCETEPACCTSCEQNTDRCSGNVLERCDGIGNRADIPCGDNQRCVEETDTTAQCVDNRCGDGVIREDLTSDNPAFEECDDGNDINDDGCTNGCKNPICGDGIVNGIEECDDGDNNDDDIADRCRTNCKNPSCGDGIIDPSNNEACDDENVLDGDGCTSECILGTCGDDIVDELEECDDGEGNSNDRPDACRENCTAARCGDGTQDRGEQCDDGNTVTEPCAYGEASCRVCSANCNRVDGAISVCGDRNTDERAGEQCDDGNTVTEACTYGLMSCTVCGPTCQEVAGTTSYCGDDELTNGEACDNGQRNSIGGLCTDVCEVARCGDGRRLTELDPNGEITFEYCDDGARGGEDEDGCNNACELIENREDQTPPTCDQSGQTCRLQGDSVRLPRGECLEVSESSGIERFCYYSNPLPLYETTGSTKRSGFIHGKLAYNGSEAVPFKKDRDVFGYQQLCGYSNVDEHRGRSCDGDNKAAYRFTVDYKNAGSSNTPFVVKEECNAGGCDRFNVAEFCDSDSALAVCDSDSIPSGYKRAYWCVLADVVGDYRVWFEHLNSTRTIEYTLSVSEQVGSSVNCLYLGIGNRIPGGPGLPGGP